jgi:hypothetical protein
VSALLVLGADLAVEVLRAEVVEVGVEVGVGEQMPGDDEGGSTGRDDRLLLPTSSGDPAVALAEEGVGAAGGADGGFAQGAGEVNGCRDRWSRCPCSCPPRT